MCVWSNGQGGNWIYINRGRNRINLHIICFSIREREFVVEVPRGKCQ